MIAGNFRPNTESVGTQQLTQHNSNSPEWVYQKFMYGLAMSMNSGKLFANLYNYRIRFSHTFFVQYLHSIYQACMPSWLPFLCHRLNKKSFYCNNHNLLPNLYLFLCAVLLVMHRLEFIKCARLTPFCKFHRMYIKSSFYLPNKQSIWKLQQKKTLYPDKRIIFNTTI